MLFVSFLLPVMALISSISAANTIQLVNHCPYDVFSWTVGPAGSGYNGEDYEAVSIPANTVTVHNMVSGETIGGGIALKLRDLPSYRVAPAGIVQVEYSLEVSKNNLWYDLSAIDCNHYAGPEDPSFCPLIRSGVKVHVENARRRKCPPAWCGADGCYNTYKKPGSWKGEPTFRCDAGTNIVVEFCTERAGPRTFHGHTEPGHPAEPQRGREPGHPTTNGICGALSPDGATCFGYAHGNCCSQYGWCGFSEAHCGRGCQHGFGDCFGEVPTQLSSYESPSKSASTHPSYAKPSSYVEQTASYYPPVSSYSAPASSYYPPARTTHASQHSHIEHTWPNYDKQTSSYNKEPTSSYSPHDFPSSATPKPSTNSEYHPAPTHSTSTFIPGYSNSSPSYSKPAPSHTIHATHTVTITRAKPTETVAMRASSSGNGASRYEAPSASTTYHVTTHEGSEYGGLSISTRYRVSTRSV